MKNNFRTIAGVVLLIIGTLLLVDRLGWLFPFTFDLRYLLHLLWPLIFIGFGIKLLLDKNLTWGILVSTFGLILLFTRVFNWDFFSVLWPLVIIGVGVSILVKKENPYEGDTEELSEDKIKESLTFGEASRTINSKDFQGGELNVSFGSLEIDLRNARVSEKGAQLNAAVAFGDIEIFVPSNCRVITKGSVVLGSWEPKLKENTVEKPVLEITGSAIFGEVTIRD